MQSIDPADTTARPAGGSGRFPVTTDIEVRFRDCDPMNHVNNAVYATYLEVGRQAYWSRFINDGDYQKVPFILARLAIDYRSPARTGETVRVALRVAWVSDHSFGIEYELREARGGRLLAEARSVQVAYDYRAGQVVALSDELRSALITVEGRPLPARPDTW